MVNVVDGDTTLTLCYQVSINCYGDNCRAFPRRRKGSTLHQQGIDKNLAEYLLQDGVSLWAVQGIPGWIP